MPFSRQLNSYDVNFLIKLFHLRIESYFSVFHRGMKCSEVHLLCTKTVNEMNDLGQSDEQISINVMTVVTIYNWIQTHKRLKINRVLYYLVNLCRITNILKVNYAALSNVNTIIVPAKSRSDVMFCLQSYGTYLLWQD